ncbi:DUF4494 domain-containing protein [Candidatus Gracilibacteria bacterium]|jgi:hypothetical protein|nr:DUF4494 domain-containing protein [Candidatus Gracilibacteria bacterium]
MKTKTYYLVKVTIETEPDENGKVKRIREQYITPAVSCLDAETKMAKYFENVKIDYFITSVSETKIIDVIE